jgi:hypothetical protein
MTYFKTVVEWFREQQGWRCEGCCMCNGTGMESAYGWDGDFLGPEECRSCAGNGFRGFRRIVFGAHHGTASTNI